MTTLPKAKDDTTLYPVCNWQDNQHKLYNALDRAYNRRDDILYDIIAGDIDEAEKEIETLEHLLDVFNSHVIAGIVYAPYQASIQIDEYIVAYDCKADRTMRE